MIPIKIECACGQHYAFDVEPVAGSMPSRVACPACGADGTAAANAIIAQAMPAAPVAPPRRIQMQLSATSAPTAIPDPIPASPRPVVRRPFEMDPDKVEAEARSKIFWGDAVEDVVKFVMMQGLSAPEATALVNVIVQERVRMLRWIGTRKILIGIGLICVPIAAWLYFMHLGILPLKIFAVTVMAGLYGAYLFITGTFMVVAPKSEPGDIADK